MVIKTGVRASAETVSEARVRAREAEDVPIMCVGGSWLNELADEAFKTWLDALAVQYGLPPPEMLEGKVNRYGMSRDGEFLRYEPDPVSP